MRTQSNSNEPCRMKKRMCPEEWLEAQIFVFANHAEGKWIASLENENIKLTGLRGNQPEIDAGHNKNRKL